MTGAMGGGIAFLLLLRWCCWWCRRWWCTCTDPRFPCPPVASEGWPGERCWGWTGAAQAAAAVEAAAPSCSVRVRAVYQRM